jgi:hypothetical protein
MKKILLILAAVFAAYLSAEAATIRLTPDGRETIQQAIDRSQEGDVIVLAAGTYYTQSPILVEHKRDLTIRGEDSVLIVNSQTYDHVFSIFDCTKLSITDIEAGHSETPFCYGDVIYITQCENVEIVRCNLYGCGVIGVEMVKCTDIRVLNCLIHDNGDGSPSPTGTIPCRSSRLPSTRNTISADSPSRERTTSCSRTASNRTFAPTQYVFATLRRLLSGPALIPGQSKPLQSNRRINIFFF